MLPQITKKQLNNLKSRLKTKDIGKSDSNLSNIIEWCEERSAIPDEEDEVFCGGIDYSLNDDDQVVSLRVLITTRRLLSQTQMRGKLIQIISHFFF